MGRPPTKRTLLLFTYLVHAYGHGLQRKQGAELGKRERGTMVGTDTLNVPAIDSFSR